MLLEVQQKCLEAALLPNLKAELTVDVTNSGLLNVIVFDSSICHCFVEAFLCHVRIIEVFSSPWLFELNRYFGLTFIFREKYNVSNMDVTLVIPTPITKTRRPLFIPRFSAVAAMISTLDRP